MNKESIKDLVDGTIRRDYGGCHPKEDKFCVLKARVVHDPPDHRIEVFLVGKWRPIRYYGGMGRYIVTNKKILAEMEKTIRINTGAYDSSKPCGQQYDPSRGTFGGKEIKFDWQVPNQAEALRGD